MHTSLPLLALTLLGALALPEVTLAQQTASETALSSAADEPPVSTSDLLAVVVKPTPRTTTRAVAPHPVTRALVGNVVNEWGEPLVGATVTVAGDHLHSVTTNAAGDYLLPVADDAPLLRVSFAGYEDAEHIARGPADLLFKLDPIQDYRRDLKKRTKAAAKVWKR